MSDVHISVVVPSREGARRLPTLLTALAEQDFTGTWEAIVVLDGVVDDSRRVVDDYSLSLPVRALAFNDNQGRSAALNAGFSDANGHVLVRCDDDLVPLPTYLTHHAASHAAGEVGTIGLYRNVYPETPYARAYGRPWDLRFRLEAYASPEDQHWRYWAGNVSVSRETWEKVGPYDTGFRAYGWEDIDWGYRLSRLGVPVTLEQRLETEHRIAATTTASRAQRAFYSGAAQRRFEQKHQVIADAPTGAWSAGVRWMARRMNENRVTSLAGVVDSAVPGLPGPLAQKAIAFTVEAAALSGHDRDTSEGLI